MIDKTIARTAARNMLQQYESNAVQGAVVWAVVNAALEAADAELHQRAIEGYIVEYRGEIIGFLRSRTEAFIFKEQHRVQNGISRVFWSRYRIRHIPTELASL